MGGGVSYQHRNLAHGGEALTFKLRGAYESLSGDFDNLINDNYTELASEVGITFPKFMAPFLKSSFKQRMRASTEFAVTFMRQERPEYTRIIAGGAWRYKWADRSNRTRRTFDLIDLNVVNLPRSTIDFIDNIAPDNPLLRYSYEDHFIMRMGYTWYHTNRRRPHRHSNASKPRSTHSPCAPPPRQQGRCYMRFHPSPGRSARTAHIKSSAFNMPNISKGKSTTPSTTAFPTATPSRSMPGEA